LSLLFGKRQIVPTLQEKLVVARAYARKIEEKQGN